MKIDVPDKILDPLDLGHVHLIGIGGAGLSAIARLLNSYGVSVSGSDAKASEVIAALVDEGIDAYVGHDPARLDGVDTVIASTAVREDNTELVEAQRRGLRIWPRSAGLQSVLKQHKTIAVAGTHGKTTTSAMLTIALDHAGLEPSFAIGAQIGLLNGNAKRAGDTFIVEADESDGAFLTYTPAGAVVTNIDPDHLDIWGTEEAYSDGFNRFLANVTEFVVLCADDPGVQQLALADNKLADNKKVIWAGFNSSADVRADNLAIDAQQTQFNIYKDGSTIATLVLQVVGAHYAMDALLAFAAGLELGADPDKLAEGLALYDGAQRRMERVGAQSGVTVYDSYAHHPTEIRADIAAARAIADGGRLIVAFQPHLASRTQRHAIAMAAELTKADIAVVADVYLAREEPIAGVDAQLVVGSAESGNDGASNDGAGDIRVGGSLADVCQTLESVAASGDLIVTMGAGDITMVGPELLRRLGADD